MRGSSILPVLSKRAPALGAVRRGLSSQTVYLPARSIVSVASRPQFNGYRDNSLKHFRGYATVPDKQWAQVIEKTGERRFHIIMTRNSIDMEDSTSVQGNPSAQARS